MSTFFWIGPHTGSVHQLSKSRPFTNNQFQFGGRGATRGFYVFGLGRDQRRSLVEIPLLDRLFWRQTLFEKTVSFTGKPFSAWLKTWKNSIESYGPSAVGAFESGVKSIAGAPSIPVVSAALTAQQVRHTPADLLRAILWGKGQLQAPETISSRWFNLAAYTVVQPAIVEALISYCVGDSPVVVGTVAGFAFNSMFDFMHRKTEDFFDPPGGEGKDAPPPPAPPPPPFLKEGGQRRSGGGEGRIGGGGRDSFDPRHGLKISGAQTPYARFPTQLEPIRDGLRVLGMTWSGATSLLQGQDVTGRDAEIVTWIYGLVKIECQECHLIWFVPESQLGFYFLHFLYNRTSIAWCRHCQVMTLVRLSHVKGIRIS